MRAPVSISLALSAIFPPSRSPMISRPQIVEREVRMGREQPVGAGPVHADGGRRLGHAAAVATEGLDERFELRLVGGAAPGPAFTGRLIRRLGARLDGPLSRGDLILTLGLAPQHPFGQV